MSEEKPKALSTASSPVEAKGERPPLPQAPTLPPLQSALQVTDANDRPPKPATAPPQIPSSTPPDQRASRPFGVQNLLNPTAVEPLIIQRSKGNGSRSDSPPTPSSLGQISRGTTPTVSTTSIQARSPIEAPLSHITPPSANAFPVTSARSMTPRSPTAWPQAAITIGPPTGTIDARRATFLPQHEPPNNHTGRGQGFGDTAQNIRGPPTGPTQSNYPRWPTYDGSGDNAPQTPLLHHSDSNGPGPLYTQATRSGPTAAPSGQPQSFFSSPFSVSSAGSTMPQPGMTRPKGFGLPPSSNSSQTPYQIMTLETEDGPIQVPVDVQAASKVADEKRKRNATASHRFRQRRKEKERETSENIAKLEGQIRDLADEKEHYQKERDFFQDFVLRHRIPVPPRPPSPRRRRHVTMGSSSISSLHDSELDERGGRQTRRRTCAYIPPSGPAVLADEPSTLPHFERLSAMPADHMPGPGRLRPHNTYPPPAGPYGHPLQR